MNELRKIIFGFKIVGGTQLLPVGKFASIAKFEEYASTCPTHAQLIYYDGYVVGEKLTVVEPPALKTEAAEETAEEAPEEEAAEEAPEEEIEE